MACGFIEALINIHVVYFTDLFVCFVCHTNESEFRNEMSWLCSAVIYRHRLYGVLGLTVPYLLEFGRFFGQNSLVSAILLTNSNHEPGFNHNTIKVDFVVEFNEVHIVTKL